MLDMLITLVVIVLLIIVCISLVRECKDLRKLYKDLYGKSDNGHKP